jgi:WD40 repeat protein
MTNEMMKHVSFHFSICVTGIISALAFCPTHTGLLAMGSYSQTTAIYREDNMELLYVLHGHEGGVTHVSQNSPSFT